MDLNVGDVYLDKDNFENKIVEIKDSDIIYLPSGCSYCVDNKNIFCDNMYNPIDLSIYDDYELYILNTISKSGFLKICVKPESKYVDKYYNLRNVICGIHKDGTIPFMYNPSLYLLYHRWVENGCKFRDDDKIFQWKDGKYKIKDGILQRVDIKSGNYIFDIKYNTPVEGCKDPNINCNKWGVCAHGL